MGRKPDNDLVKEIRRAADRPLASTYVPEGWAELAGDNYPEISRSEQRLR